MPETSNGKDGDTISFNVAAQPGGDFSSGTRNARSGASLLSYSLTVPPGTPWGNGTTAGNPSTVTLTYENGSINSKPGVLTFTFGIAASQNPPGGHLR